MKVEKLNAEHTFTPLPKLVDPHGDVLIYISRGIRIWNICVAVIFLSLCFYIDRAGFVFMTCILLLFTWRSLFDYRPELIINNEGVTIRRRLYRWFEIDDYFIKTSKDQETPTKLIIHSLGKKKSFGIGGLTKTPGEIKQILDGYRNLST